MKVRQSWIRGRHAAHLALGVAAVVLAAAPVRAWPPVAVNLQETGIDNLNLVTISCSPIWDAANGVQDQRRAKCVHTTVRIAGPERQILPTW